MGDSIPWPGTAGRYGELSTTHLSASTAALLDQWAGPLVHEAPVIVGANTRGWFISTQVISQAGANMPLDLSCALELGRSQGLGFLFFHCDAPVTPGLPAYHW
jgi:hypothetical protein